MRVWRKTEEMLSIRIGKLQIKQEIDLTLKSRIYQTGPNLVLPKRLATIEKEGLGERGCKLMLRIDLLLFPLIADSSGSSWPESGMVCFA